MMRGMFSAISGLKVNQTMLDVTANDLANVNTVGYKAERTTFQDSLAQTAARRRRREPAAAAAQNAAAGRPRRAARRGRQPDAGGGAMTTGNPLDVVNIQGRRLRCAADARQTAKPSRPTSSTRAPATSPATRAGLLITQDGHYVVGLGATATPTAPAASPTRPPTDSYIKIPPARRTTIGAGRRDLAHHRPGPRQIGDLRPRVRPATSASPSSPTRAALQHSRAARFAADAGSGAEVSAPRTRRLRPDQGRHRWRCRTSTSPPSSRT